VGHHRTSNGKGNDKSGLIIFAAGRAGGAVKHGQRFGDASGCDYKRMVGWRLMSPELATLTILIGAGAVLLVLTLVVQSRRISRGLGYAGFRGRSAGP